MSIAALLLIAVICQLVVNSVGSKSRYGLFLGQRAGLPDFHITIVITCASIVLSCIGTRLLSNWLKTKNKPTYIICAILTGIKNEEGRLVLDQSSAYGGQY